MKYTSVEEFVVDQFTEDAVIKIVIKRYADDARISTRDTVIIEKILNDLSKIELKEDNDSLPSMDYRINIYSNTSTLSMLLDRDNVWIHNHKKSEFYKIINNIDPIEMIENLNLDWVIRD